MIATLPFAAYLSEGEKQLLSSDVRVVSYDKGDLIHHHDGNCLGILQVLSGRVSVSILSDEGREVVLYRLERGEVCVMSAACVLRQITFDIHIEAETETRVLIVPAHTLSALMRSNLRVENYIYKSATERTSDIMWMLQQVLFTPVEKRIAEFLWSETARRGTDTLTLTHEQLAKYTGSAREVVSRILKKFVQNGAVSLERGTVTVTDKKYLRELI